jgi:hypothetical protein
VTRQAVNQTYTVGTWNRSPEMGGSLTLQLVDGGGRQANDAADELAVELCLGAGMMG